jgi:hypothetical protein
VGFTSQQLGPGALLAARRGPRCGDARQDCLPNNRPQVKKRLGGQVRIILSGGAPLAAHVEEFLRVAMCAPVAQVRAALVGEAA